MNPSKRFKALSFVWLLLSLPIAHIYVEGHDLSGLFMRVFVFGLFASPVWLTYGWSYLYETRTVSHWFYLPVVSAYIGWAFIEYADDYGSSAEINQRMAFILLCIPAFLILAYPSLPSFFHSLTKALNPFHSVKTEALLRPPQNPVIHFTARLLTFLLLSFVAMVLIHGAASQLSMRPYQATPWVTNLLPFIFIIVFTKPVGLFRKAMRLLAVLAGYFAATWLVGEMMYGVARLFGATEIESALRLVKLQGMANMLMLLGAYWGLYRWLRHTRHALEGGVYGQAT